MPLYALIARDKPESLELRQKVRPTHLAHLDSLGDTLVLAGPFQTEDGKSTGSFVVIEAADLPSATATFERDPFFKEGLFQSTEISRWALTINKSRGADMAHWLMKSEPDVLSYDDVAKKQTPEEWHGVRNYAARNNMKAMQLGDECFFYHSVQGKEVVGIVKVVALAHPDSTAEPDQHGKIVWECVDVAAAKKLPRPVTLDAIKAEPRLKEMALVKLSRLSVSPVTDAEWKLVCEMGGL